MDFLKKLFSPFFNPYIGPVLVISIIVFYLLFTVLPVYSTENKTEKMKKDAVVIIENLKKTRSYYTTDVLAKVKLKSNLKVNYDHKTDTSTIPLPATLVHDLSNIINEEDMEIEMYSNYPFPNREDRVLEDYEKESLAYLVNNPLKTFTKTVTKDGKKYFHVSTADIFFDSSCVKCHNTRTDTPKNDWKLGDVRGVISVTVPYKEEFVLTQREIYSFIAVLIFLALILVIHYGIISYYRQREHDLAKIELENKVEERTAKLQNSVNLLNQYKRAVDISAIVSKTDKRGRITYVNDEFCKISQYESDELIGHSHNLVRHPDMNKAVFADLWETIKQKKIWKGQIKNRAKDGSSYYVATTIVPILNFNSEIEEYLSIRLDVTDVVKSQIRAKKSDEVKSIFLANISHEIRTPLNAIIGFSEILSKSATVDKNDRKKSSIIHSSATGLLGIINDILDISKIESGNFDIAIEPTDLYLISENVVEVFSKRAIEKQIKLIFKISNDIPYCIYTDEVRLKQVISNLLSNAIKFTEEQGIISVNIQLVKAVDKKAVIRFEIEDTGIGISSEKLGNIFKPFTQVISSVDKKFEGTGLGLSISNHIIEALGSNIEVQSQEGVGSKFYFDLQVNTCDLHLPSYKKFESKYNFRVLDESCALFNHTRSYFELLGTINEQKAFDIDICTNIEDLEEARKDMSIPKLLLLNFEDDLKDIELHDNEAVIAYPFFTTKIEDSIAELISNNETFLDEYDQNSKFDGKILVAEDNITNQELISHILTNLNIDFKIEDNGLDVLTTYQNDNSFDLILMDINMPKMDGVTSFQRIRGYEKLNSLEPIPVIALTANGIKGDKEKYLSLGMNGYLGKPINMNQLLAELKKYLKQIEYKNSEEITVSSNESLDINKIKQKLGVSDNIAQLLITKFKNDIVEDLKQLELFIIEKDVKKIKDKTHYIKNSCLNICLEEVCKSLQKIETDDLSLEEIKEEFTKVKTEIYNLIEE